MNQTLKNIFYIGGGILAGIIIAAVLIFVKRSQNTPKEVYIPPETLEAMEENSDSEETDIQENAGSGENEEKTITGTSDDDEENTVGDSLTEDIKNADYKGPVFDEDDLINYLGDDFSKIQSRFGTSEQVLSSENQYFQEECLSVTYDGGTKKILVIENDGEGENQVKICNFHAGMERDEIYTIIYARMTEGDLYDDFETLVYSDIYNDISFEVDITFKNDKASKVTLKLADGNDETETTE